MALHRPRGLGAEGFPLLRSQGLQRGGGDVVVDLAQLEAEVVVVGPRGHGQQVLDLPDLPEWRLEEASQRPQRRQVVVQQLQEVGLSAAIRSFEQLAGGSATADELIQRFALEVAQEIRTSHIE